MSDSDVSTTVPAYDIDVIQQPDVDFVGLDEVAVWLDDVLSKYKDLVVTEDQCKAIKKEMAELNKIKADIKDSAKKAIDILSQPLDKIRSKIEALTKKIDETYVGLKSQVDAFADEERAKKEELVAQMIDNIFAEYPDLGTFDIPINKKWTNKSTSLKSIEAEIRSIALAELNRRREEKPEEKKNAFALLDEKAQALLNRPNLLTPPSPTETKKAPEQKAQEPQESPTNSISHNPEKVSTLTTMQILITWDASADEEVRELLRQVKSKAVSFAARKIA